MLRARLTALLTQLEPKLAAAFYESIEDIRSNASLRQIVEALERHDYEEAIRSLYIDDGAFNPLDRAISDAFNDGGNYAASTISGPGGGRVVFRFNVRSPRAERWLSAHSSGLITGITNDMRTAARQHLVAGMEAGLNPRTTALSLVGRIDRATGRRVGGVLGLTSAQERFVTNARAELMSGDRALLRNYLTRERRDRRFDRHVMAAIRDGRALESATIERMLGRYSDRLLELRGETVARTESMTALNQSNIEAYQQAIDSGAIRRQDVRKIWVSTADGRTRDSHRAMDRESVGIDQPFSNGLMYPGDTNGPASEVINCRCTMLTRVDHLANVV